MDAAVKAEHRAQLVRQLAPRVRPLPAKKFSVIYADPPWRFEPRSRITGMNRAAENHYPTMTIDELHMLMVEGIAHADAALFLWATQPMLEEAIGLMRDWDFDYRSHLIWDKGKIGLGYWFRNRHELLLVGMRGHIKGPARGKQWPSLVYHPRGRHSAKPEIFREMIDAYFPAPLKKIELFARGKRRKDWTLWGNEVEG